MAPKPPWSIRKNRKNVEEFYALREGIPDGLKSSLMSFLVEHYTIGYDIIVERVMHLERITSRSLPGDRQKLLALFSADEELLLDAIDHALSHPGFHIQQPYQAADVVKSFFDDARSVYDVTHVKGIEYEICYRQPPEVTELVEKTASGSSRAAEHLRRAWSLGFSRNADPTAACIEAIKAIEASAKATISPDNMRATLGTMIRDMNAKPKKWRTDLETSNSKDVLVVIGMMDMVWKGHSRHGNPDEPLEISAAQCEMILHTAAILVHWFSSGRVRRA